MNARLQLYLVLIAAGFVVVTLVQARPQTQVTDETLERVLNDRRYLLRQMKCALGEAPCDSVGKRLKSLAPLVLRGSCPKCTPTEKEQIQKVFAHLQKNYPKEWNKVVQQYSG